MMLTSDPYSETAVQGKYVASVIAPENSSFRQPGITQEPAALAHSVWTYNISTNSTGNVGVYVFLNNPIATGTGLDY